MIVNLFLALCFKKSWLTKITQIKLFYQKYLPVKISPGKVPLNCHITLAKHLSKYAFNVEKTSKLIVDLQHYPHCEHCKGIEKIKINKRKKTIESDPVANKKVKN